MEIIKIEKKKAEIKLSTNDIFAFRQAFNEVYFSRIDDFEQTIGVSKSEVKRLRDYFQDLRKQINPDSIARTTILKRTTGILCEQYDLAFYMKKVVATPIKDLRFGIALQKAGTSEFVIKKPPETISIEQLRQKIIALNEGIDSLNNHADAQASVSFVNDAVWINIANAESNKSDSAEERKLNVEFVFNQGIQFDFENSQTKFDQPISFSDITTVQKITNFITRTVNFFDNKD